MSGIRTQTQIGWLTKFMVGGVISGYLVLIAMMALWAVPALAQEQETVAGFTINVAYVSGTGSSYETLEQTLANHSSLINMCYEKELKAQPELRGGVSFETYISQGGFGATSIVDSTLDNHVVEHCVMSRLDRISFSDQVKQTWWTGRAIYTLHFAQRKLKVVDPDLAEIHYFPAPTPIGETERRTAPTVSNAPEPLDPNIPPGDDEEED
jgi:hypothetical protein